MSAFPHVGFTKQFNCTSLLRSSLMKYVFCEVLGLCPIQLGRPTFETLGGLMSYFFLFVYSCWSAIGLKVTWLSISHISQTLLLIIIESLSLTDWSPFKQAQLRQDKDITIPIDLRLCPSHGSYFRHKSLLWSLRRLILIVNTGQKQSTFHMRMHIKYHWVLKPSVDFLSQLILHLVSLRFNTVHITRGEMKSQRLLF